MTRRRLTTSGRIDREKAVSYEVGYCKPPKHTQFKKGSSGNYLGAPKRSGKPSGKHDELTDLDRAYLAEGARKIEVTVGNKPHQISMDEAIARTLSTRALQGSVPHLKSFLKERRAVAEKIATAAARAFEEALEFKITQTMAAYLTETKESSLQPDPHPDQIVIREDKSVEVLPTLEAAQQRQAALQRRATLERQVRTLTRRLHKSPMQGSKLADRIKRGTAELKRLSRFGLADFPGIQQRVDVAVEHRLRALGHPVLLKVNRVPYEEAMRRARELGLPVEMLIEPPKVVRDRLAKKSVPTPRKAVAHRE